LTITAEGTQNSDYFVGTNSSPRNAAEALHHGIITTDETLFGIFDGIFYDSENKRVGGIALNDFLVITDQFVTLWARDQSRDFVDHFPLSHAFVLGRKQKDPLHGTLKLGLVMPNVPLEELNTAERLEITFDLVPLVDIDLASSLVDVLGCAHRDLLIGGASEEDCHQATRVLFAQVFMAKFLDGAVKNKPQWPRSVNNKPNNGYAPVDEPMLESVEDSKLEAFMTPLSRLDQFEKNNRPSSSSRTRPASPYKLKSELEPRGQRRAPGSPAFETGEQSRLYNVPSEPNQGYISSAANGQVSASLVEQELRKFNSEPSPTPRGGARRERDFHANNDDTTPPTSGAGTRLRDEVNNSEALYVIGRAGRTMFDNLDKLRREAEAKGIGVAPMIDGFEKLRRDAEAKGIGMVPLLGSLRDSGMNVRDITELLNAASELLDTLGRNPAARELAMMFASKALGENGGKMKPGGFGGFGSGSSSSSSSSSSSRKPERNSAGKTENASSNTPPPANGRTKVKVERRDKPQVTPLSRDGDEAVRVVNSRSTSDGDEEAFSSAGSQTKIIETPLEAEIEETFNPIITQPIPADPPKPVRRRLAVRGGSSDGAADGGEAGNMGTTVGFSASKEPDLN